MINSVDKNLNIIAVQIKQSLVMIRRLLITVILLVFLQAHGQNVGIGTMTPHNSAKLDITSNNSGLLIPRLTTSERDAISNPADALLIFNTSTRCYEWWDAVNGQWIKISCPCTLPIMIGALNATSITSSSFTANWLNGIAVDGYQLTVATDINFTNILPGYNNLNVGNVISYNVTGVSTCVETYYYRVRAYNSCGESVYSNTITVNSGSLPATVTANPAYSLTNNSFTANWSSVTGASGYHLTVATDPGFTNIVPGYNNLNVGSVTNYNVVGINRCNNSYYYRVRAYNYCGNGNYSNVIEVPGVICNCLAFGGTSADSLFDIISTSDGGYLLLGETQSFGAGGYDAYVIKLYSYGGIQWTRTIGGAGAEAFYDAINTSDGGYVLSGYTTSYGAGGEDGYIVKLDGSGNVQWTRAIGGAGFERFRQIKQTLDNGFILVGRTTSYGSGNYDVYIAKLDENGTLQWTRAIGGTNHDVGYAISLTSDGGYIIGGYTASYGMGNWDCYIIKLNHAGNIDWTRTVGGTQIESIFSIFQTTDGGYIMGGHTASYGAGALDFYVVRLSSTGTLLWTRTVGGAGNEVAHAMIQTNDGGFVLAGYSGSYGAGVEDAYVVKINTSGVVQWTRTIGGPNRDRAHSIVQLNDGTYVVAGLTLSFGLGSGDGYVARLDASGNLIGGSAVSNCCRPGTGGVSGSGGLVSSGGLVGYGANVNSGGLVGSGGIRTVCP